VTTRSVSASSSGAANTRHRGEALGKNNGYLLYDEVNELLPSGITASDELDELFDACGNAGIEIIDSDQKHLRDETPLDRIAEDAEELELDLTAGALDKTSDPVRTYLREMGTVPLHLTSHDLSMSAYRRLQQRRPFQFSHGCDATVTV
jgi:hypothetical protein